MSLSLLSSYPYSATPGIVALGLMAYSVYSLIEARYRQIVRARTSQT